MNPSVKWFLIILAVVICVAAVFMNFQGGNSPPPPELPATTDGGTGNTMTVLQAKNVSMQLLSHGEDQAKINLDAVPVNQPFRLSVTFHVDSEYETLGPLCLEINKRKANGGSVVHQSAITTPKKIEKGVYQADFEVGRVPDPGTYQLTLDRTTDAKYFYDVFEGPITFK